MFGERAQYGVFKRRKKTFGYLLVGKIFTNAFNINTEFSIVIHSDESNITAFDSANFNQNEGQSNESTI